MFLPVTMELLRGFWETVKIFFLTLAFSLPLGLVVAFGSMSRFCPLKRLTQGFVWIIRGTPLMLQLIAIFYGPGLLFDIHILGRLKLLLWLSSSIMPAIFRKFTAAASRAFPGGSMRPDRCWA